MPETGAQMGVLIAEDFDPQLLKAVTDGLILRPDHGVWPPVPPQPDAMSALACNPINPTTVLIDFCPPLGAHFSRRDERGVMGTGTDLSNEVDTLTNKHDWAGLASMFAADAVYLEPTGHHQGREAIRAFLEAGGKAFPDIRLETSLVIEEGDTVVAEWTVRGTNSGPLPMRDGTEIPATGKTLEYPGVTVGEVRNGKFVTMRDYFDNVTVMSQLGLMPTT